jgi:hypothetical protein
MQTQIDIGEDMIEHYAGSLPSRDESSDVVTCRRTVEIAAIMIYERVLDRTGVRCDIGNTSKRLKGASPVLPVLGLIVIPPPWFCVIRLAREEP